MTPLFLPLSTDADPSEDPRPHAVRLPRTPRAAPAPEASDGGIAAPASERVGQELGPPASVEAVGSALRKLWPKPETIPLVLAPPEPEASLADAREERLLFITLRTESGRVGQTRLQVELEWRGGRFNGEFVQADPMGSRLEPLALATLEAVEAVVHSGRRDAEAEGSILSLEGVVILEALGRRYVLAALQAGERPRLTTLSGLAAIDHSVHESVVIATLRAADRWVRGQLAGVTKD